MHDGHNEVAGGRRGPHGRHGLVRWSVLLLLMLASKGISPPCLNSQTEATMAGRYTSAPARDGTHPWTRAAPNQLST